MTFIRQKADLIDKVAVISGATSGIGLALAARAAQQGMQVAIVDRDQERLRVALKRVSSMEVRSIAVHMDMSDLAEVRKLAGRIEVELGPPWLVCNYCEMGVELSLRTVAHGIQVFAPILAECGVGHIVNILSEDSLSAGCPAVRAAVMHAIVGISESLYRELDCLGSEVGVSLVCPARGEMNFRTLAAERRNAVSHPVISRVREVLRPETLAEHIFGAVTTRTFQVFSDGPEICEPFDGPATQLSNDARVGSCT